MMRVHEYQFPPRTHHDHHTDHSRTLDIANEAPSCRQTDRPFCRHLPLLLRYDGEQHILGERRVEFRIDLHAQIPPPSQHTHTHTYIHTYTHTHREREREREREGEGGREGEGEGEGEGESPSPVTRASSTATDCPPGMRPC